MRALYIQQALMKHVQQFRRKFIQLGITGFCTTLFASLPKIGVSQPPSSNAKGVVVHEHEGEHILTGRRKVPMTIKISEGKHGIENISFCTEDLVPGRKMRVHKHLEHDELIFIHQGEGLFTLGEEVVEVRKGAVAFVPKGVWHGLENTGKENLFMTFGYSPAGFEGYFRENGTAEGSVARERTEEEYSAKAKYGMVYK
jgi:quercetin dioxygenase-like cupin family protein